MTKRQCMEPGCTKQAEIYLKRLTDREYLCGYHATMVVNAPHNIAQGERDEYLQSGGKVDPAKVQLARQSDR